MTSESTGGARTGSERAEQARGGGSGTSRASLSGRIPMRRSRGDRIVAGVAGGIAEHFDIDPTLVRLGFVVLTLTGGAGVPLYAAAWLIVPEAGEQLSLAEDLTGQVLAHGWRRRPSAPAA